MKPSTIKSFCILLFLWVLLPFCVFAQDPPATHRIETLESRLVNLENKVRTNSAGAAEGAVAFLFGAFCALWAQNTGRNPWTWFFLGVFLSVITVLVLLSKNAADRKAKP